MTAWLATWLAEGCVAVFAAAVLTRAFRLNAATRYVAWWMALIAVGALTWTISPAGAMCAGDCGMQASPSEPLVYIAALPNLFISVLLGVWLSITLVRLLRIVPSLHAVHSLRDRCTPFPPAIEAQLSSWLEVRGRGRAADLVIHDALQSATVLGFHRPCIAVPSALVDSLTAAELDHVILHEYAHVRRRDDWTRLAQTLVQSVFWVHPAVALIGRQLDREREMACDEWVAARTGQPKVYARCLARAAEVLVGARSPGATEVAPYGLTPTLFGRVHDIVRRVDRLLSMRGAVPYKVSTVGASVVAIAIVSGVAAVRTVPLVDEIGEVGAPFDAVRRSSVLRPMDHKGTKTQVVRYAEAVLVGDAKVGPDMRARAAAQALVAPVNDEAVEPTTEIPSRPVFVEAADAVHPLESRAIAPAYSAGAGAPRTASERQGRWNRLGATAAQIGVGAGRAGVSLGGIVSRAGTSAARRF